MDITNTVIVFAISLIVSCSPAAPQTWHLNDSYAYQPDVSTAWNLSMYPGLCATPFMAGEPSDVSAQLCFLDSEFYLTYPSYDFYVGTVAIYMYPVSMPESGAIIWTVNRDINPIGQVSTNMTLTLRGDGNLVLWGKDPNTPFWSTNTSHQGVFSMDLSINPVSLNLRTKNGSIVWQSASYPTDTLTMNQVLRPNMKLTSMELTWTSTASLGSCSLVMEPGGLALYYTDDTDKSAPSQVYWMWGAYGSNDTFSVKHTCEPLHAYMDPEGALHVLPLSNVGQGDKVENASYWRPFCDRKILNMSLNFEQYGKSDSRAVANLTILRLENDGNLKAYTLGSSWSPQFDLFGSNKCLLPNYCGPYGICSTRKIECRCPDYSIWIDNNRGCNRLEYKSMCHDGSTTMEEYDGLDYFSNEFAIPNNISTIAGCSSDCLSNCSCAAAFWHNDSQSCYQVGYVGTLHDVSNGQETEFETVQSNYTAFLKVALGREWSGSRRQTLLTIGLSVSTAVFVCVFLTAILCYCKKLRSTKEMEDALFDAMSVLPTRFSYNELIKITDDFQVKLGKGGFGSVYAGSLSSGTKVAVKRLEGLKQGDKEFRAEVAIMGDIRHNNLLRLLGFCANKGHRMLVYEYIENGSLDQWLFDKEDKKKELTWERRCRIALGTARGLEYLHEACTGKILHLDIKPQNILLDENFEAKVADFGLSRLVGRNETHVMTTMRGTPGYLAPDWLKEGAINEKCDVFSFGMLLMEIISGRRNLDDSVESMEQVYYPEWAFWEAQKEDVRKLSDATIESEEGAVQLRRMINTAFLCVLEDSTLRPSMCKVVRMLQGDLPVDRLVLLDLHQSLMFILRIPSSFARMRIEEAVHSVTDYIPDSAPLLNHQQSSHATFSMTVSGR